MRYLKTFQLFEKKKSSRNRCLLIDGTSSSGKSYMSKGLKKEGWIIIGSDDFSKEGSEEMRIPFDHEGEGKDKQAGEKFHKEMLNIRGKKEGKRGYTNVDFPKHPKNKEFRKISPIGDPRVWYMYQDYLWGRGKGKNVIFDDIGSEILKYLPDCEYILLYTPLEDLKRNIIERTKKGDPRGQWVFSEQFLDRYKATTKKSESIEPEKSYTKEELENLLFDKKLQKSFGDKELDVDDFLRKLGLTNSKKEYWIKLKKPLKKNQKFFNSRDMSPKDLEDFINK
jgi:hypothetical protein